MYVLYFPSYDIQHYQPPVLKSYYELWVQKTNNDFEWNFKVDSTSVWNIITSIEVQKLIIQWWELVISDLNRKENYSQVCS